MIILVLSVAIGVLLIFTLLHPNVFGNQSNSTNVLTDNFGKDLKLKINNMISNYLNETGNILNSSSFTNQSNLSSSSIIISNNKVISSVNNNGSSSTSTSSTIKDQVKTVNGVCTSTKIGGNGNDTLASYGSCNDELTGGSGADKFMCGGGNDTITDYNSKEGDSILDKQNCEKIL